MSLRLVCCVLLLITPAISSVCDLTNCSKISSQDLKRGVELNQKPDVDLTRDVMVLTGLTRDSCKLSLEWTSSIKARATFVMELSENQVNISLLFTFNPEYYSPDILNKPALHIISKRFNIAVELNLTETPSDVLAFGNFYDENFMRYELLYDKSSITNSILKVVKKLLRGEKNAGETINRTLSAAKDCDKSLTVSFCPCKEPVIANLEWDEESSTLICSAVSKEGHDKLDITWQDSNGTVIPGDKVETNGDLMKISSLSNVTLTEEPREYICTASLQTDDGSIVTSSKTIRVEEKIAEPDEDRITNDPKKSAEAFLTIIVCAAVFGVVIVALISFGVLKLVRHFKEKKLRHLEEDLTDEQQVAPASQQDRELGEQIERTYQELELLQADEKRM